MNDQELTQPNQASTARPLADTQPTPAPARRRRLRPRPRLLVAGLLLGLALSAYLFAPLRSNVLILGLDRAPQGTAVARSDTIVLATFQPARPYVGLLSIPRDLWVVLPDGSSNRINTAHYFAEAAAPGSGPAAARATVQSNFGVDVHYTLRLQFSALTEVVDALGGVTIELEQATALYPAGRHQLDGERALAFVRDREASDDFGRMARGQLFAKALVRRVLQPAAWPRLPLAVAALTTAVDTDVPAWQWPRLGLCLLRVGPEGFDGRVLDRSMARGFTTADGAQVLAPDWSQINPLLLEMFGQ